MKTLALRLPVLALLVFPAGLLSQVTEFGVNTPCNLSCTSTIDFSVSGTISSVIVGIEASAGLSIAFTLNGPGLATPVVIEPVNGNLFMSVDDGAAQACSVVCAAGCGTLATPQSCSPDTGTLAQAIGATSDASQWSLSLSTPAPPLNGPEGSASLEVFSLTLDGSPPLPVELQSFEVQ